MPTSMRSTGAGMAENRRLVVGPSWVGDMVMAQSLLRLLKAREPESPIDLVAPGWSLPVVARMPEVDDAIVLDTAHGEFGFGKRRALGRELRDRNYAQAIVLPRSLKAALLPFFARVPVRTGYRGEMRFGLLNDIRPFDRERLNQTVKRFVFLGLEPGEALGDLPTPRLDVDASNQARFVEQHGLDARRPVIAMMPGAEYGPAKCWPLEHFSGLAVRLLAEGYAVWVLGSAKDAAAGEAIAAASGAENLCGRTSLEDVIDVLALADQAVSNDSGLMHVAAAAGTRVHGIYGSSSPAFTPPLTEQKTIHYLGLDCSPCFRRECPLGHLDCLTKITVEQVFAAIVGQAAPR